MRWSARILILLWREVYQSRICGQSSLFLYFLPGKYLIYIYICRLVWHTNVWPLSILCLELNRCSVKTAKLHWPLMVRFTITKSSVKNIVQTKSSRLRLIVRRVRKTLWPALFLIFICSYCGQICSWVLPARGIGIFWRVIMLIYVNTFVACDMRIYRWLHICTEWWVQKWCRNGCWTECLPLS